jgi:hypothetical protein
MKSTIQKFILLGIVVFLIGGLSFVRNWTPSKEKTEEVTIVGDDAKTDAKAGSAAIEEAKVYFPVYSLDASQESEYMVGGMADFWFQNANDYDVDVGIEAKSCKCSRIEVQNLTDDQEQALRKPLKLAAAADCLAGASGLLPYLTMVGAGQLSVYPFMGPGPPWRTIAVGDDRGQPVRKHSTAFLRLGWDGRNLAAVRLGIKLWVQRAGDPKTRGGWTQIDSGTVNVVGPIRFSPAALDIHDMDSTRTVATDQFYVWSSSRANMTVTAYESTHDPAFICVVTPLTGPDFRDALAELKPRFEIPPQPVLLYRVLVIVRDQPPEAPLDWGAFHREIVVKTDKPDISPIIIPISGRMRGPVTVGVSGGVGAPAKVPDTIILYTFPARDGIKETTPLSSTLPGLKLEVDRYTPSYLNVDLQDHNNGAWDLTVEVPANRLFGKLPETSAVILKTVGPNSRRIHIPILGKATISSSGS